MQKLETESTLQRRKSQAGGVVVCSERLADVQRAGRKCALALASSRTGTSPRPAELLWLLLLPVAPVLAQRHPHGVLPS